MIALESQGFSQDDANIRRLCALGEVSRASYYRHFGPHAPAREDADLRDLIQRQALANRHYGYRRIAQALRRQGLIVNAKRVLRLMREDSLLALRTKPFVPRTSDSRHGFAIRPNLARWLRPTGLDQLWVADITYVRLAEDFVYLAVVIDAFSRKVVGFALANHLEASLALGALDQALAARDPPPDSLIHHSDRGVQGGFKWSSQHLDRSCDEHSKTALGSFWAGALVLTRSTAGGRARGAAAVLGSDCGRHDE
jgi:putative transposase